MGTFWAKDGALLFDASGLIACENCPCDSSSLGSSSSSVPTVDTACCQDVPTVLYYEITGDTTGTGTLVYDPGSLTWIVSVSDPELSVFMSCEGSDCNGFYLEVDLEAPGFASCTCNPFEIVTDTFPSVYGDIVMRVFG